MDLVPAARRQSIPIWGSNRKGGTYAAAAGHDGTLKKRTPGMPPADWAQGHAAQEPSYLIRALDSSD